MSMFGNSGSAPIHHNPTLLPATSVSPSSASPLFNLPPFVSQSADHSSPSALFLPSSVIVPPQPHQFYHQIGTSPSTTSSVEAAAPIFGVNPLMTNLIASLASLSRPHPIISQSSSSHQNGLPFIAEVFQNSLAECLRHSSSTPNAKSELSFHNAMDNNNNNNNGSTTTTTTIPNANLLNTSLSSDHLAFAQYSSVAQKSLSSVELLQRALEAFAVANQSKTTNSAPPTPSVTGNPLITPSHQHIQSEQYTNGATTATAMSNVEQQLLSLLNFSQLNNTSVVNKSSKNGIHLDTLPSPFVHPNLLCSNGICHSSSTITATTTSAPTTVAEATHHNNNNNNKGNKQTGHNTLASVSAAADLSMPIDLSSSNPQHSLLFSSTANLAQSSVSRGAKSCDIRRSASSVSYKGNADVHEHFQRTFSGKWPRRQPSLRSHLQVGGGRAAGGKKEAALCIGENETAQDSGTARTEEPMEEEEEEGGESAARDGTEGAGADSKLPVERAQQKTRPKSRQQVKSVYTAVIRKLFTSNEVKQVEDHFRKSLGEDRFLQIQNEQQRKQREEQPNGDGSEDKRSERAEEKRDREEREREERQREEREREEREREERQREERQRDEREREERERRTNIVRL